jgi:hypothetical protein
MLMENTVADLESNSTGKDWRQKNLGLESATGNVSLYGKQQRRDPPGTTYSTGDERGK